MNGEELSREQFALLVQPHLAAIRRFAATLGSLDDADDLVQEAMERAWVRRTTFDPARGAVLGWLIAIVRDRARRRWLRTPRDVQLDDRDLALEAPSVVRVDLRRAINALPERQRLAIVLYHYIDLKIDDIAVVMACSTGTVKSTLHDGREALAQRLGDSYARS